MSITDEQATHWEQRFIISPRTHHFPSLFTFFVLQSFSVIKMRLSIHRCQFELINSCSRKTFGERSCEQISSDIYKLPLWRNLRPEAKQKIPQILIRRFCFMINSFYLFLVYRLSLRAQDDFTLRKLTRSHCDNVTDDRAMNLIRDLGNYISNLITNNHKYLARLLINVRNISQNMLSRHGLSISVPSCSKQSLRRYENKHG